MRNPAPQHTLFIGDSLTAGVGNDGPQAGYRADLIHLWTQSDPRAARADRMVAHRGWQAPDAWQALRATPIPAGLQLIIVELGTNDAAHGASVAAWQQDYLAILQRVRASAPPPAQLICLGPWIARDTSNAATGLSAGQYAAWEEAACLAYGGTWIALFGAYAAPRDHDPAGDTFHPNAAGYAAIAALVAGAWSGGIHRTA